MSSRSDDRYDSYIRYISDNTTDTGTSSSTRTRQGHLLGIIGFSTLEGELIVHRLYYNVLQWLAMKHVNERSDAILPDLPLLLGEDCDFQMTFESRDSHNSIVHGVEQLVAGMEAPSSYMHSNTNTNTTQASWQHPFAIAGGIYSSVTTPMTTLSGVYGVPFISGSATSAALDGKPLFSRTIPTNAADAKAAMVYYSSLGLTHVVCFFEQEPYGAGFSATLKREAGFFGITLVSIPFTLQDLESSVERLKKTGIKNVFLVAQNRRLALEAAVEGGVMGTKEYTWISSEMIQFLGDEFELNRENPNDMNFARGLDGVGILIADIPANAPLRQAIEDFRNNNHFRNEFIAAHPEMATRNVIDFPPPPLNDYQSFFYDSVVALGIAACHTPGLFTGAELHETLVNNVKFRGASGNISFNPLTGTRSSDSARYQILNMFVSEGRSNELFVRFGNRQAVVITNGDVQHTNPYLYYNNGTQPPANLPPVEHDYNLRPMSVQVFGWVLGSLVMSLSVFLIVWTFVKRLEFVVRASQPVFLCQLCVGTFLMASAVFSMSMQGKEPSPGLDAACMANAWLIFLGFVTAISALFSKTWRLNKLMNSSITMRRIKVEARDVVWPFAVLMTINVAMLLGWTFVSPHRYERVEENYYDTFGRNVSSFGKCKSENNNYLYFLIPMLLFDFIGLSLVVYQSYRARNHATELSESSYLAISAASLLETLILGGPILLAVLDNPTALYVIASAVLCISCMTILIPVFGPKYFYRPGTPRRASTEAPGAGRRSGGGRFSGAGLASGLNSTRLSNHDSSRSHHYDSTRDISDDNMQEEWGKMKLFRATADNDTSNTPRISGLIQPPSRLHDISELTPRTV